MKDALIKVISTVTDKMGKLDLLTTIEVLTENEELNQACIELRNEICDEENKTIDDLI